MSRHDDPIETTEVKRLLPEVLREVPTGEFPRGKRELAMFLHAAWKGAEDGRQTMKDILHELQAHGVQGTELVQRVERRYDDLLAVIDDFQETVRLAQERGAQQTQRLHDAVTTSSAQILEASQEQSWQACDRLEQVAIDLGGVSGQLEAQSQLAAEQLQVHRSAASAQASTADIQRQLLEQLEATRRDSARLSEAWTAERRARRRQTLLTATVGLALAVVGGLWLATNPSALREASAAIFAQPSTKAAPARRGVTALPAGMRRAGD